MLRPGAVERMGQAPRRAGARPTDKITLPSPTRQDGCVGTPSNTRCCEQELLECRKKRRPTTLSWSPTICWRTRPREAQARACATRAASRSGSVERLPKAHTKRGLRSQSLNPSGLARATHNESGHVRGSPSNVPRDGAPDAPAPAGPPVAREAFRIKRSARAAVAPPYRYQTPKKFESEEIN